MDKKWAVRMGVVLAGSFHWGDVLTIDGFEVIIWPIGPHLIRNKVFPLVWEMTDSEAEVRDTPQSPPA